MDEDQKHKYHFRNEFLWVMYRQKKLHIIESKLLLVEEVTEKTKDGNLSSKKLKSLNIKLNNMAIQVNALNEEGRRTEYKESDE